MIEHKSTIPVYRHKNDIPENYTGQFYWDNCLCWYVNGKYHREDGPSFINDEGDQEWNINGRCHRLDGPAIIYSNGRKRWFLDDKEYSEKEFWKHSLVVKNKLNRILTDL